ncbi:hypothetical protein, partial [Pararhodobacter sp.]
TTQPIASRIATWRAATPQRRAKTPGPALSGARGAALIAFLDDLSIPSGRIRLEPGMEPGLPLARIFEDAGFPGMVPISPIHQVSGRAARRLDHASGQEAPSE